MSGFFSQMTDFFAKFQESQKEVLSRIEAATTFSAEDEFYYDYERESDYGGLDDNSIRCTTGTNTNGPLTQGQLRTPRKASRSEALDLTCQVRN